MPKYIAIFFKKQYTNIKIKELFVIISDLHNNLKTFFLFNVNFIVIINRGCEKFMKPNTSFEKVLFCLTMVFLIIIAYNKIIEISNIKTIEIFDTTPLNFIQIEKGLDKQPDPVETEKSSDLESQINIADISQKPVNINTATANQLMQIKGIGEVLAQRIIDFRTTNGNFKALEELMLIKGIGEATFEKIKPYVSLQ